MQKSKIAAFILLCFVSISTANYSAATELQSQFEDDANFASTSVTHSFIDPTLGRQLELAVDFAEEGQTEKGFELARDTRNLVVNDIGFSFKFIETMILLAATEENECDSEIFNEAIRTANVVHRSNCCDGKRDPELGFRFMVSLGKLGTAIKGVSPQISAQLFKVEGQIAQNLLDNNRVPRASYVKLADSFYDAAVGQAIKGNHEDAFSMLEKARDLGFTDFELVTKEEFLTQLPNIDAIKGLAAESVPTPSRAPETTMGRWARETVDSFQPFPFKFDVPNAAGGKLNTKQYSGKLILVDIWATWCPPCRDSIPHLARLQNKYGGKNFQVVGLSVDSLDDPESSRENVLNMMKDMKANYPTGLAGHEIPGQIKGDDRLPMVIFMDGKGKVKFAFNGFHSYQQLEAITQYLLDESRAH